jgi:hypothetical protein
MRRIANHCEQADCLAYVLIVDNRQKLANRGVKPADGAAPPWGDDSELGPWLTYHCFANRRNIGREGATVGDGLKEMVNVRTAASKATIRNSREPDGQGRTTFQKGKVYARVYSEEIGDKVYSHSEFLREYVRNATAAAGGAEEEEQDDWVDEARQAAEAAPAEAAPAEAAPAEAPAEATAEPMEASILDEVPIGLP